ncbi:hypothetical protein OEV98_10960 [Caldibacillus lycopersici]|uniref:Uncharacterized protein n=1 Tax=Perspicuibacillus lycopersici TaxID=1325689 RepID=A0AAE3LR12_9BACI|nr:hypothetical protein [Perspicuibacillus lycopersici]MCU9614079.1 hypothetical protein [Perspicuibacillus lycopersici]
MEALEEYILNEVGKTREEFEKEVEAKRDASPLKALQEENATLLYDAMIKDFKIETLEQDQANLMYLVMMGGME